MLNYTCSDNAITYVMDISAQSWSIYTRMHPSFYYLDITDEGQPEKLFYAQGTSVYMPDYAPVGTQQVDSWINPYDHVAPQKGLVETGGTNVTTVTLDDLSDYDPDELNDAYINFYDANYSFIGTRRITSSDVVLNTVSWASNVGEGYPSGGGALTVPTGSMYVIAVVRWVWTSGWIDVPGLLPSQKGIEIDFDWYNRAQGLLTTAGEDASYDEKTDNFGDLNLVYFNALKLDADRPHKQQFYNQNSDNIRFTLSSPNGARVRTITLGGAAPSKGAL